MLETLISIGFLLLLKLSADFLEAQVALFGILALNNLSNLDPPFLCSH